MRTLEKILVFAFLFGPLFGSAQIVPKKTTIKKQTTTVKRPSELASKANIKSKIPTLAKVDLKKLQSSKTGVAHTEQLNVPQELLTLPSRKKYRITPKKPYDNGLGFSFFGNYSPEAFTVSPRLSGQTNNAYSRNDYYTYSGFIVFNALQNKAYRVKIELADVIGSGEISINDQISSVSSSNRTINYIFNTTSNGQYIITMGPYERDGAVNPIDFKITSIQIDELED